MAKKDQIAQITMLEDELTAAGVTFEKQGLTEQGNTVDELEAEIQRLEAMVDDDDIEEVIQKLGGTVKVRVHKGINLETVIDDRKVILKGGTVHTVTEEYAAQIMDYADLVSDEE